VRRNGEIGREGERESEKLRRKIRGEEEGRREKGEGRREKGRTLKLQTRTITVRQVAPASQKVASVPVLGLALSRK